MEERIKLLMSEILNVTPESINGTTTRDEIASWDSLNHINLIVGLEQEFAVSFDVAEIESMSCFDDVVRLVKQKL
jgi:acyl carrier protein